MDEINDFDIFGYTTLLQKPLFFALKGENVETLRLGMVVELRGDSRGFVPSGFEHGERAIITAFAEPYKEGREDHIVRVGNLRHSGWVKPWNVSILEFHGSVDYLEG